MWGVSIVIRARYLYLELRMTKPLLLQTIWLALITGSAGKKTRDRLENMYG